MGRLFTVSTLDSANKDRGVGIETLSEAEQAELLKAEEQIKKLIPRGARKNKFTLQNLIVSTTGIDERIANKAIYKRRMALYSVQDEAYIVVHLAELFNEAACRLLEMRRGCVGAWVRGCVAAEAHSGRMR